MTYILKTELFRNTFLDRHNALGMTDMSTMEFIPLLNTKSKSNVLFIEIKYQVLVGLLFLANITDIELKRFKE